MPIGASTPAIYLSANSGGRHGLLKYACVRLTTPAWSEDVPISSAVGRRILGLPTCVQ
jgi:hypothetical protein